MIATIHTLKGRIGFDDDTYRDFLARRCDGKRSSKELSVAQASRVIEDMRELAGQGPGVKGAVAGLDTPAGSKLRALWIAGYDLGVVRVRTDAAMLGFVERQTGVSHIRFLKDVHAGNSAIQGLKAWLARAGKVAWPSDRFDVIANKRAVLDAQWRQLIFLGDVKPIGGAVDPMTELQHYAGRVVRQNRWGTMQAHDYDDVQNALGRRLRGALARRDQSQPSTNEEN